MSAHVYRAFNTTGDLLYVGTTIDIAGRLERHARDSAWHTSDTTFTTVEYATVGEARAAEVVAIQTEFPRWNIADRSPNHPDGPARSHRDVAAIHGTQPKPRRTRRRKYADCGHTFRGMRRTAELPIDALAERAGVTVATISRWERGETGLTTSAYEHITTAFAEYLAGRWQAA